MKYLDRNICKTLNTNIRTTSQEPFQNTLCVMLYIYISFGGIFRTWRITHEGAFFWKTISRLKHIDYFFKKSSIKRISIGFYGFYVILCQGVIHLVYPQNLLIIKIFHGHTPRAFSFWEILQMFYCCFILQVIAIISYYWPLFYQLLLLKGHSYWTFLYW